MSGLYLGIDGGGTRSHLVLTDGQGNLLKENYGGGFNIYSIGVERVKENVVAAIEPMIKVKEGLTAICLGCAGLGREADREIWKQIFKELRYTCKIILVTDSEAALYGGLHKREGIVIVAGTGSIAVGFNHRGEFSRAGGFGHIMGDFGSAYDIGRNILVSAVKSHDKMEPPTILTELLFKRFKIKTTDELIPIVYGYTDKKDIASIASLLPEAVDAGDAAALSIAAGSAQALAELVWAVAAKLGNTGAFDITTAGGVLTNNKHILNLLKERVAEKFPETRFVKPKSTPAYGAALMAIQG